MGDLDLKDFLAWWTRVDEVIRCMVMEGGFWNLEGGVEFLRGRFESEINWGVIIRLLDQLGVFVSWRGNEVEA